jgi:uncharacterized protein YfaP (DUF2135 family)
VVAPSGGAKWRRHVVAPSGGAKWWCQVVVPSGGHVNVDHPVTGNATNRKHAG